MSVQLRVRTNRWQRQRPYFDNNLKSVCPDCGGRTDEQIPSVPSRRDCQRVYRLRSLSLGVLLRADQARRCCCDVPNGIDSRQELRASAVIRQLYESASLGRFGQVAQAMTLRIEYESFLQTDPDGVKRQLVTNKTSKATGTEVVLQGMAY